MSERQQQEIEQERMRRTMDALENLQDLAIVFDPGLLDDLDFLATELGVLTEYKQRSVK